MKKIFFSSLFVASAFANTSLVIEKSSSRGVEQKAILIEDKTVKVIRNTNLYDEKSENSLGAFTGQKSESIRTSEERLNQITKALKESERILKKNKNSFVQLDASSNRHGDKIYLNKILINEDSTYFEELRSLITKLDTSKFEQTDGARLSKDKKQIEFIKKSKVASKEKFMVPFFCDAANLPAKCILRNQGTLYLK